MLTLSGAYNKSLQEEATLTAEQLKTRHVGKQDPKRHLEEAVEKAVGDQVVQNLGTCSFLSYELVLYRISPGRTTLGYPNHESSHWSRWVSCYPGTKLAPLHLSLKLPGTINSDGLEIFLYIYRIHFHVPLRKSNSLSLMGRRRALKICIFTL
jgi:hypothetical protein